MSYSIKQEKERMLKNQCLSSLVPCRKTKYEISHSEIYTLKDIIETLIESSEILLKNKDYDGHGWEKLFYATESAKLIEIKEEIK